MLHAVVSEWNTIAADVWAALFNSLAAVCIVTGCVWLLLDRMKTWSAATRYAGWCGILAIAIALPAAQLFLPHRWVAINETPAAAVVLNVSSGDGSNEVSLPLLPDVSDHMAPQAKSDKLSAGGGILLLWALAMALQLARLAFALRHNSALKRSASASGAEMNARWRELLRSHGDIRRPVMLATSSRITMPAVVGYLRPVILLPDSLAARLAGDQLDGILLHELAHVRRYDDWAIAVQRFLEAVFALHPLVHLITSKLELQREIACDDWVLRTQQARVYASSLTTIAECCLRPAHSGLMGLAMERSSQLGERVELLLDNKRSVATRVSWKWVGSFASALVLTCLVSLQLPEVMAFPVQATPVEPSPAVAEPMPVPVVTPEPAVSPVPPIRVKDGHSAEASKELAREQAELSAMQRELGKKQAELVRREMQLAHKQMEQAHLQDLHVQQQLKLQLEPQMRRLQEQLSHMNLDETVKGAVQAQIHAGELASKLANLQALNALSRDGLMGKGQLSDEEMSKIRAEQERYRAQAAELGARQAQAAKEFSDRLNVIINEALAHGLATPKK